MPRKHRSRTLFHLPIKLRVALAATMSPFERMKIIKKHIERPSNRTAMVMAEVEFLKRDCVRRREMLRQRKEASLKREENARVPGSREAGKLKEENKRLRKENGKLRKRLGVAETMPGASKEPKR